MHILLNRLALNHDHTNRHHGGVGSIDEAGLLELVTLIELALELDFHAA